MDTDIDVEAQGDRISTRAVHTDAVTGRLYADVDSPPQPGVLLCHGSGGPGGYEREYARLLAQQGYAVLCVAYFDAPGVPDALQGISLSYFADAARWLLERPAVTGSQVGVVGFSRGGEAALLTGSYFDVVGAVVAYVPSCYVFPAPTWMDGVDDEGPAWTLEGDPLPYLPVDRYVPEKQDGIADAIGSGTGNASLRAVRQATPAQRTAATIPVERIRGPICLVSGGKDEAWPSETFADRIVDRLDDHEHPWPYEHCRNPKAGHAIRVPCRHDERPDSTDTHWLGGTVAANARAAASAWDRTLEYLSLGLE